MNKIKVIFEPTKEKPYIIIWKPKDLPSAPLSIDDKNNALSQAGDLFPSIYKVEGIKQIEHGLVHRLDTATDGLILIATNQECYDFIQQEQKSGNFIKTYTAKCRFCGNINNNSKGFPFIPENINLNSLDTLERLNTITVSSYFRPFGQGRKEVRPVTEKSGKAALKKLGKEKLYTTEINIKSINKKEKTVLVECRIKEGYRHQVRCHLAWLGLPIINDKLYGHNQLDKKNAENPMEFSATKLQFECPKGDLNSYEIAFTWT